MIFRHILGTTRTSRIVSPFCAGLLIVAASATAQAQDAPAEAEIEPAAAQPAAAEPAAAKPETARKDGIASDSARLKAHSVNLNPIGALLGSYSLNYQHVFGGQHGILVEGRFSSSSSDGVDSSAIGGSAGYRWLWSKEQDSGFLGLNIAYDNGSAETKVDGETYDVTLSQVSILPNIGRRWTWDAGLNVTLRFGVGRAFRTLSTNSKDAAAKEAVSDVQEVLDAIPVAFDGELSIGWVF